MSDGKAAEKKGEVRRPAWILRNTFRGQKFIPADLEDKKGKSPD